MNKSSFFIVGQHAVIEALRNPKRKVLRVFLTEESKKNIHRKNPNKNVLEDVKVYFKSKKELDKYTSKEQLMHNGYVAEVEHLDQPDLKQFIKEKKNLREKNFWVYGFDAKGQKDFTDIKWEGNNILLFGSEGFGMRQHTSKYADFFVKININEDIESLNISNSAAIVFHHLSYIKKKS